MEDEEGRSNTTLPIPPASPLGTALTSGLTPSEILSGVNPDTEKLGRIQDLLNECYGYQFKEVHCYEVNGKVWFAKDPDAMASQFEIPQEMQDGLKEEGYQYKGKDLTVKRLGLDEIEQVLEEERTNQKQLIKAIARELRGTQLKEVYAYKVNDVLFLDENAEAIVNQFGIPESELAGLQDVGYQYDGTHTNGGNITVRRIGLREAVRELEEQILPSAWRKIQELENELSGITLRSEAVCAYHVNNMLCIVESPQALARSLNLPEKKLVALEDVGDEYRGKDSHGEDIKVKHVGLYDAVKQLSEQLASRKQYLLAMVKELWGHEFKEVSAYEVNGALHLAESLEALQRDLKLPENLVGMKARGDFVMLDNDTAGERIQIRCLGLKEAVKQLQAKRDATPHRDEQPMSERVPSEMESKARDVESLDMVGERSGRKAGDDNQSNQELLDKQFELFINHEKGKQTRDLLAEIADFKRTIGWEKGTQAESKYHEQRRRFDVHKKILMRRYTKNGELNENCEIDNKNGESIIKDMNNALLAARSFLVEHHYLSFLATPQGRGLAQLESDQANNWQRFEQDCSVEVRREVQKRTAAIYYSLQEELVKAHIHPNSSHEQMEKCIGKMKAHIEETNKLMSEKIEIKQWDEENRLLQSDALS